MKLLLIFIISLSFLAGCGPSRPDNQEVQVDPEKNARFLMQSGDFSAAALEYLALAKNDRQNASVYRL